MVVHDNDINKTRTILILLMNLVFAFCLISPVVVFLLLPIYILRGHPVFNRN